MRMAALAAFIISWCFSRVASFASVSYTHLDVYKRQVLQLGNLHVGVVTEDDVELVQHDFHIGPLFGDRRQDFRLIALLMVCLLYTSSLVEDTGVPDAFDQTLVAWDLHLEV